MVLPPSFGAHMGPYHLQVKIEDVENYEEVLAEVEKQLRALCDPDKARKL